MFITIKHDNFGPVFKMSMFVASSLYAPEPSVPPPPQTPQCGFLHGAANMQINRQADIYAGWQAGGQAGRLTGRQEGRQVGKQANRQAGIN